MHLSLSEFLALRHHLPVVDVRSEAEYAQGHILQALNVPLLNNDERHRVGTTYKQLGQHAAIREGFRLVGPRLDDILGQAEEISQGREMLIHCWRGGMRSSNFAQFVGMAGMRSRVLQGGYKTYRQAAAQAFQTRLNLVLLTGFTGSGKTEALHALREAGEQVIDLEGLAHHRGSAFGGLFMPPQPTTEQFQNDLFEEILKVDASRPVWVEDESIAIGKIFLPPDFWQQMTVAPIVELKVPLDVRIARLVRDYGHAPKPEFSEIMKKIGKKLGGQHLKAAEERLTADDLPAVMEILLTYYDKAYRQSIEKRHDRLTGSIVWSGSGFSGLAGCLVNHIGT
jgi:tRNA 2-selenouridine synthase